MRKVSAGLFITLDGVVESPSTWLLPSDDLWPVIGAGVAQSDAVLLGRRTYLEFAALWPPQGRDNPMAAFLNDSPKYVVSSRLTTLDWAHSSLVKGDLPTVVATLKAQPGKNIQIPGSPRLVRSLLREGLLDELALLVHPVVLGSGLRLFDDLTEPVTLKLAAATALSSGVVVMTYQPATAQP